MRHAVRIPALLALALAATVQLAAAPPQPDAAQQAICRPQITADGQSFVAGTGFLLEANGKTLLVTALHLFGPNGGMETQVGWADMPAHVSGVDCTVFATGAVWQTDKPLLIPGAEALGAKGPLRDLAAFPFTGSAPVRLKLAAVSPKAGDSVWLVAQVLKGAPRSQLLHHGVVSYAGDDALEYRMDNDTPVITATSGAPVVNAKGEVVAVNLAGGVIDSHFYATGDSLVSLRRLLAGARPAG
jgi:hypothetical protein